MNDKLERRFACLTRLSPSQAAVFDLLGHGLKCSEIATRTNRSVKTIDTHAALIRRKLQMNTLTKVRVFSATYLEWKRYKQQLQVYETLVVRSPSTTHADKMQSNGSAT